MFQRSFSNSIREKTYIEVFATSSYALMFSLKYKPNQRHETCSVHDLIWHCCDFENRRETVELHGGNYNHAKFQRSLLINSLQKNAKNKLSITVGCTHLKGVNYFLRDMYTNFTNWMLNKHFTHVTTMQSLNSIRSQLHEKTPLSFSTFRHPCDLDIRSRSPKLVRKCI